MLHCSGEGGKEEEEEEEGTEWMRGKGKKEEGAVDEMSVAVRLLYRLNQTLTLR